jgi:hypothetical protein
VPLADRNSIFGDSGVLLLAFLSIFEVKVLEMRAEFNGIQFHESE